MADHPAVPSGEPELIGEILAGVDLSAGIPDDPDRRLLVAKTDLDHNVRALVDQQADLTHRKQAGEDVGDALANISRELEEGLMVLHALRQIPDPVSRAEELLRMQAGLLRKVRSSEASGATELVLHHTNEELTLAVAGLRSQ